MLESIKSPADIKKLSITELQELSEQIRNFLIKSISKTGGHIGPNLGVIELTTAIHYSFNAPHDTILFDVGHQGYTHKILTGRLASFPSLNTFKGMSRFITRKESPFDELDASHAGTAISIGSGIAYSNKLSNSDNLVISVVGDGALVEGMSFEGLNFSAEHAIPLIIIINDNGMSIPRNVGGINNLFKGDDWQKKSQAFFEGLGFRYIPVSDGHQVIDLVTALEKARKLVNKSAVVVHVKTEKGRGLALAKDHPYKMHFSMPFDPETGAGCSAVPPGKSYTNIVGSTLTNLLSKDEDIVVLTPATPYASGIEKCLEEYPERVLDVGMAEQHMLGMATGLALKGKKVFACYQATFLQRAWDQLFHDICYMDLPVTIISARSGFSGFDSPTHHAIYDISYLRSLPNLQLFYAGTSPDLKQIIEMRATNAKSPLLILHPYEAIREDEDKYPPAPEDDISQPATIFDGKDGYIITAGNRLETGITLRNLLQKQQQDFGLLNIRWIKPLPADKLVDIIKRVKKIITLEENIKDAGLGSSILELIAEHDLNSEVHISAIKNGFIPAGDKDILSKLSGIDAESVYNQVVTKWKR